MTSLKVHHSDKKHVENAREFILVSCPNLRKLTVLSSVHTYLLISPETFSVPFLFYKQLKNMH